MNRPKTLAVSLETWRARLEAMAASGDRAALQELAGVDNPRARPYPAPCCAPVPEPEPDDDLVTMGAELQAIAAQLSGLAAKLTANRTKEKAP